MFRSVRTGGMREAYLYGRIVDSSCLPGNDHLGGEYELETGRGALPGSGK